MSTPQDKNSPRSESIISKALQREPEFVVSPDFADRVLMQLETRRQRTDARDWMWLGLGLGGFVIAATVGIVMSGFKPSLGVLTFLSTNGPLVIFGASFVIALQWVDRKFVRKNTSAV